MKSINELGQEVDLIFVRKIVNGLTVGLIVRLVACVSVLLNTFLYFKGYNVGWF